MIVALSISSLGEYFPASHNFKIFINSSRAIFSIFYLLKEHSLKGDLNYETEGEIFLAKIYICFTSRTITI